MAYTVKDGFSCDKTSKEEFIVSTTAYWNEQAPEWTITFYGIDNINENGQLTDFNIVPLGTESEKSHLDLAMEATNGDITHWYAFELKERWGKYVSTFYGDESLKQEPWIYNMEKDDFLDIAKNKGFKPMYVNLYPDDIIRVWDISKIDNSTLPILDKWIKEKNVVEESPKKLQKRYGLWNNQGKTYKRWRTER